MIYLFLLLSMSILPFKILEKMMLGKFSQKYQLKNIILSQILFCEYYFVTIFFDKIRILLFYHKFYFVNIILSQIL